MRRAGGQVKHVPAGRVHWRAHVKRAHSKRALWQWLADPLSLTSKLEKRSLHFHVRLLHQGTAKSRPDECKILGLRLRTPVWERQVLLCCGEKPVVFARTAVSRNKAFADWPYIRTLGQRPLGKWLFADHEVIREAFQFAELPPACPDAGTVCRFLGEKKAGSTIYARRSLFRRRRGRLLVTEFFLPPIMQFIE